MTDDAITARNRANAARSTGPLTRAGKAAIAQNARRHGATGKPDPDRIVTRARIILDRPDLDAVGLRAFDERTALALALAAAEARLAAALQALRDFEDSHVSPPETIDDLVANADLILDLLSERRATTRDWTNTCDLANSVPRMLARDIHPGGSRHRLLRRYVSEARSRRSRAFAAWVAHLQGEENADLAA